MKKIIGFFSLKEATETKNETSAKQIKTKYKNLLEGQSIHNKKWSFDLYPNNK